MFWRLIAEIAECFNHDVVDNNGKTPVDAAMQLTFRTEWVLVLASPCPEMSDKHLPTVYDSSFSSSTPHFLLNLIDSHQITQLSLQGQQAAVN